MNKSQKLTLAKMKKMDAKNDEKIKINVHGFDITIDRVLRPTKLESMVKEATRMIIESKEKDIVISDWSILTIQLVKHFTDVEVPDELEKQITVLTILVDNNLLEPIIESFDKDEISRASDVMQKAISKSQAYFDSLVEELTREAENTEE